MSMDDLRSKQKPTSSRADKVQRKTNIGPEDNVLLSTKHLKLKDKPGKLRPQYIGPFKVLQMVRCNAAKLELPPGMKVHPVFNVALLKRYHGQHLLPNLILVDGNAEYKVEQILKHHGRIPITISIY